MTVWDGLRGLWTLIFPSFIPFISVHLSWVGRGNVGMYKVTDDLCFIVSNVVVFVDLCLFRVAHFLDVAYTLYTHGINAKKSHNPVVPFR